MRRPPPRHVQLHLPPLSGNEARRLAHLLERMLDAIWRVHGEQMGEAIYRESFETATPAREPQTTLVPNPQRRSDDDAFDDDIPF